MKIIATLGILLVTPILLVAQVRMDSKMPVELKGNLENGKKVFMTTCFACHGMDGKGAIPGVPDFTKSSDRFAQPDSVLLNHVINGFQSPGSMMPMPPKGGNANLTEQDIFDAITYIRSQFGNSKKK